MSKENRMGKDGSIKNRITVVLGCVLFLICCIFGRDTSFAFWQSDLTYEGDGLFLCIKSLEIYIYMLNSL